MSIFKLLLGNLGEICQFILLLLAIWTFVWNRNSIFRNTLQQRQIETMEKLRRQLHEIWFDVFYCKQNADFINSSKQSLSEFQESCPESYEQALHYKKTSLEVFYLLPGHYLIPKWIDGIILKQLYTTMQAYLPFTLNSLRSKTNEEIKVYQDELLKVMNHIDSKLAKNV